MRDAKCCGAHGPSRYGGARSAGGPFAGSGASGFTLLEVIIAVSIIAVGFVAVFSLNSRSVSAGRSVEFYSKAPLLAVEKLSDVEKGSGEAGNLSGDFGEAHPGYTWKASITAFESENFGEFADRLKKIDIVVSLGDGELTWRATGYRYFKVGEEL